MWWKEERTKNGEDVKKKLKIIRAYTSSSVWVGGPPARTSRCVGGRG